MLQCPTGLVLSLCARASLTSCPTCSRASRASRASCPTCLVPYMHALVLDCLLLYVLSSLTYLVLYVFSCLVYVLSYMLSILTCLTHSYTSCAFCLDFSGAASATCSVGFFAPPPSLASGVARLTYSYASLASQYSCLVALVILVLELFEFFTAWVEVNHCDVSFLKRSAITIVFSITDVGLQDLLTSLHQPISCHQSLLLKTSGNLWFSGSRARDYWHGMG